MWIQRMSFVPVLCQWEILDTLTSLYVYCHWMKMQVKMNVKVYFDPLLFHVFGKEKCLFILMNFKILNELGNNRNMLYLCVQKHINSLGRNQIFLNHVPKMQAKLIKSKVPPKPNWLKARFHHHCFWWSHILGTILAIPPRKLFYVFINLIEWKESLYFVLRGHWDIEV